MTDVLIRNVPEDVLAGIDELAAKLGLSRGEFLRRQMAELAHWRVEVVSVEDLREAAELSKDLLDEDIMRDAWS